MGGGDAMIQFVAQTPNSPIQNTICLRFVYFFFNSLPDQMEDPINTIEFKSLNQRNKSEKNPLKEDVDCFSVQMCIESKQPFEPKIKQEDKYHSNWHIN